MKNRIITPLVLTFLVGCWNSLNAQHVSPQRPFWVIEGNINTADYTIIRFYTADSNLIQEERVEGFLIDIQKKKNRKYLDKRLVEVIQDKVSFNAPAQFNKRIAHGVHGVRGEYRSLKLGNIYIQ